LLTNFLNPKSAAYCRLLRQHLRPVLPAGDARLAAGFGHRPDQRELAAMPRRGRSTGRVRRALRGAISRVAGAVMAGFGRRLLLAND
jgi:hypothetical protein